MDNFDALLSSFCCRYCAALDCADDADELPAMSSELAAMRNKIEEFYQNYIDMQGRNSNRYALTAEPKDEEYRQLTLPPGIVAEMVSIHEYMLLRESREMFRGLMQSREAVKIRIVDEPEAPF